MCLRVFVNDTDWACLTAVLSLEADASRSVSLARVEQVPRILDDAAPEADRARAIASHLGRDQRRVRGLYSGGTLCKEASIVLHRELGNRDWPGHTLVDLGDDEFTVGRPHPMIDFRLRNDYIAAAAADLSTAVILLDIVLGYGSHPDPADALAPALQLARNRLAADNRTIAFVPAVCGTSGRPQRRDRQQ